MITVKVSVRRGGSKDCFSSDGGIVRNMDQKPTPADETDEQKASERLNPTSEEQTIDILPVSRGGIPPSGSGLPVGIGWGAPGSVLAAAAASLSVDTTSRSESGVSALPPTETQNSLDLPEHLGVARMPTVGTNAGLQPQPTGPAVRPISAMTSAFSNVAYSQQPNQAVSGSSRDAFSVQRDLWLQQMLQAQALQLQQQQFILAQHHGLIPGRTFPITGIPQPFLAASGTPMYAGAFHPTAAPASTAAAETLPAQHAPILQPSVPRAASKRRRKDDHSDEEPFSDDPPYNPEYKPTRTSQCLQFLLVSCHFRYVACMPILCELLVREKFRSRSRSSYFKLETHNQKHRLLSFFADAAKTRGRNCWKRLKRRHHGKPKTERLQR